VERSSHQKKVIRINMRGDAVSPAERPLLFCGDIDMRIARDGTWFYQGSPIPRPALVKLFASVLQRDEDGDYWLKTPVEKARIQVEDAPFVAVELSAEGEGRDQTLTFRTNLDEHVTAGPEHPLRVAEDPESGEPSPYLKVREGLEALIARPVYYELAGLAEESDSEPDTLGVWSEGVFFPLGQAK
jgi:hypothetical protein